MEEEQQAQSEVSWLLSATVPQPAERFRHGLEERLIGIVESRTAGPVQMDSAVAGQSSRVSSQSPAGHRAYASNLGSR